MASWGLDIYAMRQRLAEKGLRGITTAQMRWRSKMARNSLSMDARRHLEGGLFSG